MGEFTSAEDALDELYNATPSDPYDDTQDALRDHLQGARDRVLSELTALRAENARLRTCVVAADGMVDECSPYDRFALDVCRYREARSALDAKEG